MHITRIVIGTKDQLETVATTPRTSPARKRARRSNICLLQLTRAQVRRIDRQTEGVFTEMLGRSSTPLSGYNQGFRRRNLPDEQTISELRKVVHVIQDISLQGQIIRLVMAIRQAGRNTQLFVR